MKPFKIAILTTDKRDHERQYDKTLPEFGTAPEALLTGLSILPEAEIHVISCVHQPIESPDKIAGNIYYHSLLVPPLGWMRTFYQGCIRATRKKLKQIQPDIVHGQGTERDCAISAVFSGFPNVLTIHGNMRLIAAVNQERPFSFNWMAARLEGFTLPRTDGVICITHHTQEAVRNLTRRTWVLPNAVDAGFFDVKPTNTRVEPPTGLCVGTICHHKNQNHFIRALDSLAKERQFKIIFLGNKDNGPYGEEFLELIKTRPWCEYRGFAEREALKEILRSATFVVLPTLEDNCPMVVLEAMAAGVPVLASRVGGIPDLIQPEITGLLCDPQRPESFAWEVRKILDDSNLAGQLATKAKAEALKRFHPKVIARGHLEIYHEILQR